MSVLLNRSWVITLLVAFCAAGAIFALAHSGPHDSARTGSVEFTIARNARHARVNISFDSRRVTPATFPALLELPLDRPIAVDAVSVGFAPFHAAFQLTAEQPTRSLLIELPAFLGALGFAPSDLPAAGTTGLQREPTAYGIPDTVLIEWVGVDAKLGARAILSIDRSGVVYRNIPGAVPSRVGRIEAARFARISGTDIDTAGSFLTFEHGPDCRDCGDSEISWSRDAASRPTTIARISVARDARLDTEGVTVLLKWFLAVARDAGVAIDAPAGR